MNNSNTVYGKPYFTSIHPLKKQFNYISESMDTEVVIIGGGVSGAIAAYYFTKANIPTILVEKNTIGYGSTSITTSLLQYELDDNIDELEKKMSKANVIKAYQLCFDALGEIEQLSIDYNNPFHFIRRDTLLYSDQEKDINSLQYEYEERKINDFPVEYIDELEHDFPFPIKGGVLGIDGGAEIDPYLFTHFLIDLAIEKGLKVFEKSEVLNIDEDENGVTIEFNHNIVIHAKKAIVATGYQVAPFTNINFGHLYTTYNIVTKPVHTDIWKDDVLVRTMDDPYYYLRTTIDHRIIIGGEDTRFVPGILEEAVAERKYNKLLKKLKNLTKIKDLEIDYAYSGTFLTSPDNLGYFGDFTKHQNIYLCLGYGANGILFAMIGAPILVDLYLGKQNHNLELFKVRR